MNLFGSHGLLYNLINGILVAISGTNKERRRKGIALTIAMIFIYLFIWLGLSCFGYQPVLSLVDISLSLYSTLGGFFSVVVGVILIVPSVVCGLAYIVSIFALFIGSLIALIKKREDDGSPRSAFIANLIGMVVIILIPILFII